MIADQLRTDGFGDDVFTTQPGYNGIYERESLPWRRTEDGVNFHRAGTPGGGSSIGRLAGGVVFGALLVLRSAIRRKEYDALMVSTVPPVLMGMCGALAARLSGAKLVCHCMDPYREIAEASGHAPPALLARVARLADSRPVESSEQSILLSEDMKRTLVERGLPPEKIHIQNNFIIGSNTATSSVELPAELQPSGRLRMLFAGKIRRFQGLTEPVEGFALHCEQEADTDIELLFLGAGAAKSQLQDRVAELGLDGQVIFADHQPLEVAMDAMTTADDCELSFAADLIGSAYPSKTVTYLEMGARVLSMVEPDSEVASLDEDENLGVVGATSDPKAIAAAISSEHAREASDAGAACSRFIASSHFLSDATLPNWADLMLPLGQQS